MVKKMNIKKILCRVFGHSWELNVRWFPYATANRTDEVIVTKKGIPIRCKRCGIKKLDELLIEKEKKNGN